jgi:hypothetical protein
MIYIWASGAQIEYTRQMLEWHQVPKRVAKTTAIPGRYFNRASGRKRPSKFPPRRQFFMHLGPATTIGPPSVAGGPRIPSGPRGHPTRAGKLVPTQTCRTP